MSSINFNNLQDTSKNKEQFTYVDFHFDFAQDKSGTITNSSQTIGSGRDIKVAYDLNAIVNSLQNLFNTIPGERFLLPEYGADLQRYVFEPITVATGNRIGRKIRNALATWEPRVKLLNIDITGFPDKNEYQVDMSLVVPFLEDPLGITGFLSRDGYLF